MLDRLEGVMKPRVAGRFEEDLLEGIRETMDTGPMATLCACP